MKLINIGETLINLDKITMIDLDTMTIYFDKEFYHQFKNQEELDKFVFQYNLYDTEKSDLILERIARVVLSNPEYLTKEGIREQINIWVKYYQWEDWFKEISEGIKLKDLPTNKLMNVFKQIRDRIKEEELDAPY